MFEITPEMGERISTRCFLLGVLMARTPQRMFHESYVETVINFEKAGIKYRILSLGGCSDLAYGRNLLAARFLKSECSDLIWIDDDICWNSEDIMRLVASPNDVVGGMYRRKIHEYPEENPLSWCGHPLPKEETETDAHGAVTVEKIGFGFIKTSRESLERLIAEGNLPHRYDEDLKLDIHRFFHFDGLGHSEDYDFCKNWRSIGGKIWCDPAIKMAHVGEFAYQGNVRNLLGNA